MLSILNSVTLIMKESTGIIVLLISEILDDGDLSSDSELGILDNAGYDNCEDDKSATDHIQKDSFFKIGIRVRLKAAVRAGSTSFKACVVLGDGIVKPGGVPNAEGEVCLLCEPGHAGGDGEEEGSGSKGGVDGDKGGAERRGGALAAKQKKETEESNYKL